MIDTVKQQKAQRRSTTRYLFYPCWAFTPAQTPWCEVFRVLISRLGQHCTDKHKAEMLERDILCKNHQSQLGYTKYGTTLTAAFKVVQNDGSLSSRFPSRFDWVSSINFSIAHILLFVIIQKKPKKSAFSNIGHILWGKCVQFFTPLRSTHTHTHCCETRARDNSCCIYDHKGR